MNFLHHKKTYEFVNNLVYLSQFRKYSGMFLLSYSSWLIFLIDFFTSKTFFQFSNMCKTIDVWSGTFSCIQVGVGPGSRINHSGFTTLNFCIGFHSPDHTPTGCSRNHSQTGWGADLPPSRTRVWTSLQYQSITP